jgi:hypothetical protein
MWRTPMGDRPVISSCRAFCLSTIALAAVSFVSPLLADPPDWSPALTRQIGAQNRCKVLYILNVREYQVAGRDVVEAKVQCEDTRSFDVVRRAKGLPFEITACKPTVC